MKRILCFDKDLGNRRTAVHSGAPYFSRVIHQFVLDGCWRSGPGWMWSMANLARTRSSIWAFFRIPILLGTHTASARTLRFPIFFHCRLLLPHVLVLQTQIYAVLVHRAPLQASLAR